MGLLDQFRLHRLSRLESGGGILAVEVLAEVGCPIERRRETVLGIAGRFPKDRELLVEHVGPAPQADPALALFWVGFGDNESVVEENVGHEGTWTKVVLD
jgi:hypothetical protein